jgi:hypothetical protein
MDGVIQLLGTGGMVPAYRPPDEPVPMSPRRRGVKQGAVLLLSGIVLVPILGTLANFSDSRFFEILAILAALICFIGGPMRMLFAALFEEGAPKPMRAQYGPPIPMHVPQQFGSHGQAPALPPPPVRAPSSWRRRPNTAELVNPPSVTENTTRLLEKEDRTDR